MEMRRTQYQAAGRARIEVAGDVVRKKGGHAQIAAYLVHVGLECLLKARIMWLTRVTTLSDLEKYRPTVAARLFRGAGGHDLAALASAAALARLVAANGEPALAGRVWERMCGADRPYSLRYGAVAVDRADAEDELKMAHLIQSTLEGVIR